MYINAHQMAIINCMVNSKVTNYVWPGMESSLLGGEGFGTVRLFENTREQHTDITPHSHRYNFVCIVLRGQVTNKIWRERLDAVGDEYSQQDLVYNGEIGSHSRSTRSIVSNWGYTSSVYDAGDTYSMDYEQIHSIKFSRNALVLFLEGPSVTNTSQILQPVINDEVVPTFKVEPWMFKKS